MSLLGPRPPLTYHPWPIEEYTEEQLHMFDVRPGFSGWAQVHGRKDVEWNHRIELNVWYVRHVRFSLDVQIFFSFLESHPEYALVSCQMNLFDNVGVYRKKRWIYRKR